MAGYVSLQDVTKTYQMGEITIKAADGISFDVEKGEFVIVVGPSGAGKTTVLVGGGVILAFILWYRWDAKRETDASSD